MQRALKRGDHQNVVIRSWWISLGIGMVVIGAVAVLLSALATTVARIEAGAAEIWRVGKLIANNTVHVPLLIRTNQVVADILPVADGIARATERIQRVVGGDGTE
ncbi:MAG: hypothetical protein M3Q71_14920 [Chloroflexota bacterium]|nr:hypothetical protein [Chloroflexota bacterium]